MHYYKRPEIKNIFPPQNKSSETQDRFFTLLWVYVRTWEEELEISETPITLMEDHFFSQAWMRSITTFWAFHARPSVNLYYCAS